ncbi:MAG: hypothetical protein AAF629_15000 [Chloroflexota bacterium]
MNRLIIAFTLGLIQITLSLIVLGSTNSHLPFQSSTVLASTHTTPGFVQIGYYSGTFEAIAVNFPYAYLGDSSLDDESHYLHIFDISNLTNPISISSILVSDNITNAGIYDIALTANVVLVANGTLGVQIIDVSNPISPTIISQIDTPGHARKMVISDTLVFVADGSAGLQIIDISDILTPTITGHSAQNTASDIVIANHYAYLGGKELGIFDIANPVSPTLVSTYSTDFPTRLIAAGDATDNYLFAPKTTFPPSGGFVTLNISNPLSITEISQWSSPGFRESCRNVQYQATLIYMSCVSGDLSGAIYILNMSNPMTPVLQHSYTVHSAQQFAISNDYVFVASDSFFDGGFYILKLLTQTIYLPIVAR